MNVLSLLEYRNYAYNRSRNPEFEPKLYASLFEDWEAYEDKYQEEKDYWDSYIKGEES